MDKGNFGDIKESEFLLAFKKLGISLTVEELRLLKQKLDLKNNSLFEIAPLIRVIGGIPTKQFLPLSLLKLAVLVQTKDWSKNQCAEKLNPKRQASMDITEFKQALSNLTSAEFVIDPDEVEEIFGYITKMPREKWATVVKIDIDSLVPQIFSAIDAIIVEDVRISLKRQNLFLVDLLHKHDLNKDGMLSHSEIESLLTELGVVLSSATQTRFFRDVLDKRDAKRVSMEQM